MNKVKTVEEILDKLIKIDEITLSTNSFILDRNNEIISEVFQDYNRIYLTYKEIPDLVINAFLSTEDRRFFQHKGYDPTAIFRAIVINSQSNSIEQGASTITQQLVRNYFLGHEQTYNRKLSELLYAYQLEKMYSKEQIIELYVNTIFFQNGIYGFEAASRFYFGRSSNELSLAEIAFLTAIPNNPAHYNPLNNSQNTKMRQEWILAKMLEVNIIEEEEFNKAVNEEIKLSLSRRIDLYPDYVTYIYEEFKQLVTLKEGYTNIHTLSKEEQDAIDLKIREKVETLFTNGIKIYTSLDPEIQRDALKAIDQYLGDSNTQSAVVVIDHQTNELLAITGGKNYQKFNFHRGYQAYRQPGSTIKPLLVYGPYLQEFDVSLQSQINANHLCINEYCPKTYGGTQHGMVTLERAFKHSFNTPAIRILDRVGINTAFSYLEAFSFSKLDPNDYRLPAAIGGFTHGISILEMTNAYTTFSNEGYYQPSYGIKKVTDLNGNVLYEWNTSQRKVWSRQTNEKMRTLLSKAVFEGTGRNAVFQSTYIGGKTGTTNDVKDLWFIGLTDKHTAGVWIGKDIPESIHHLSSQTPHLTIWKELMIKR